MESDEAGGGRDIPQNLDAILGKIKIDRENTRRYKAAVRVGFSIGAFCLGWWGFIAQHQNEMTPLNLLQYAYQTFQLLTFNMPNDMLRTQLPWQLQVTRFALPGLAIYATLGLYLDKVRRPLKTFLTVRRSGHLIVVGGGDRTMDVIRRCVVQRHSIVAILPNTEAVREEMYDLGVAVIVGEIGNPQTYIRGGISHARAMVILADGDAANLRAMLAAHDAIGTVPHFKPPLRLACEVQDGELRTVLSSALSERRGGQIQSHVIDFMDNVARNLVVRLAPVLGGSPTPHILVVGDDKLVHLAVSRIALNAPEGAKVTIVAPESDKASATFRALNPGAENLRGIRFIPGALGAGCAANLADLHESEHFDAIVICTGDELGIATAVSLCRWRTAHGKSATPILVRQRAGNSLIKGARLALADPDQAALMSGFGDLDQECSPDLVLRASVDRLARAIHAAYIAAAPPASAVTPWADLAETFREACRHQADHIGVKLAMIGLEAVPCIEPVELGLDAETMERLAEIEHWRWCVSRWLDGWTLGETKDAERKITPYLVPYSQLSEEIKDYDRDTVRNIPALLLRAGLATRSLATTSATEPAPGQLSPPAV